MIFLDPVDWIAVQDSIFSCVQKMSLPSDTKTEIEIWNMGPGYGMSTSAYRLPHNVSVCDMMTFAGGSRSQHEAFDLVADDIAIVGMAVDLPGAPDVRALWTNLVEGVNSCSEVGRHPLDHVILIWLLIRSQYRYRSQGSRLMTSIMLKS